MCVCVYLHALLTCSLDGGEFSASRPGGFILGGNSAPYPLDMREGTSQSGGDKGKHSDTFRQSNLGVKTVWSSGADGVGVGWSPGEDDNSVTTEDRSHIAQLCTERAMPVHHS